MNEPPVKAEPAPAPSPVQETVPQVILQEFAAADRDGNGFLTPDEVRGRFPFIERNFSQVDANGDGRISPLELARSGLPLAYSVRRPPPKPRGHLTV